MFFDSVNEIEKIALKNGCSVFVLPDREKIEIKNAIVLKPEDKTTITIEQVKEILGKLSVKQTSDLFVLIRPADVLGEEAANALLKNLEEPKQRVHFVLITEEPSRLLATILSRSAVYFLRLNREDEEEIHADKKVMDLAKKLVVAKPQELISLAEELTKKKDGAREYVLMVLATAIEILYKSYYKTGKKVFLIKLPRFLKTYENIEKNGHIKLHLIADLI
jgi:transcription antitermination factor NusA-like protein